MKTEKEREKKRREGEEKEKSVNQKDFRKDSETYIWFNN